MTTREEPTMPPGIGLTPAEHKAEVKRQAVRKTEMELVDAIRENLTPQAVTAIAAYLDVARVRVPAVQRQIEWFANLLREQVGDEYNALLEEIGL